MSPQQVFSIASSLALVSWILLAILPRRPWVTKVVTTKLVPGLFAILYTAIAVSLFWRSPGGFSTLASVGILFSNCANPGMSSLSLDIDDPEAILAFSKKVVAEYPALNVLINNSGIMRLEDLVNHPEDLSVPEATITTNLLDPIRLTSALLPHLTKQSQPVIMNVTSGLAFAPLAFAPVYCATKAALHSWTESIRYQMGRTGIQVIELPPPYVQTELTGPRHASDPLAMPLHDFIAEAIQILQSQPDVRALAATGSAIPARRALRIGPVLAPRNET